MAASSKGYPNTSTNALLDPNNHHHHHPRRVQFSPQLELQDHHHNSNQMPFNMMNHHAPSSSSHPPSIHNDFMRKYGSGSCDLTDLDQAFHYLAQVSETAVDPSAPSTVQDHQRQSSGAAGMRPPTLNIFPSQPMHAGHPSSTSTARVGATTILSSSSYGSRGPSELFNDDINTSPNSDAPAPIAQSPNAIKGDGTNKGSSTSSGQDQPKASDPKTLRRLAQNREAARKSRLRKKAYVQQLESSRIKLTHLEQELHKAKTSGVYLGGMGGAIGGDQGLPLGVGSISAEAAAFNMEYTKWLEEKKRLMVRLHEAVEERLPENEIRACVENCIAHFDNLMHLKSMIIQSDVFYITSGMWMAPAERCFLWIGGFRPSELIKIIPGRLEPLTDQQIVGIIGLQKIMAEAEEALSQQHQQLNQSLSEAVVSENLKCPEDVPNYMGQMAAAINKMAKHEDIVIQADNLRLQTIHRLHQMLTTRQAARSLLVIADYFHRLHSLSSLWSIRKRQP